jgi:hypothetical protein
MAAEEKEGGAEWMQKLWRPAMGWMYMLICMADMIVFPVLWSLLQAFTHTSITQNYIKELPMKFAQIALVIALASTSFVVHANDLDATKSIVADNTTVAATDDAEAVVATTENAA